MAESVDYLYWLFPKDARTGSGPYRDVELARATLPAGEGLVLGVAVMYVGETDGPPRPRCLALCLDGQCTLPLGHGGGHWVHPDQRTTGGTRG